MVPFNHKDVRISVSSFTRNRPANLEPKLTGGLRGDFVWELYRD